MSACPTEWSGETGGPGRGNGTGTIIMEEMAMRGLVADMEWAWEGEGAAMIDHKIDE